MPTTQGAGWGLAGEGVLRPPGCKDPSWGRRGEWSKGILGYPHGHVVSCLEAMWRKDWSLRLRESLYWSEEIRPGGEG